MPRTSDFEMPRLARRRPALADALDELREADEAKGNRPLQLATPPLAGKEALGEGGNECDFNEQADDRLECREDGNRIPKAQAGGE